jgi:hypothetical protein
MEATRRGRRPRRARTRRLGHSRRDLRPPTCATHATRRDRNGGEPAGRSRRQTGRRAALGRSLESCRRRERSAQAAKGLSPASRLGADGGAAARPRRGLARCARPTSLRRHSSAPAAAVATPCFSDHACRLRGGPSRRLASATGGGNAPALACKLGRHGRLRRAPIDSVWETPSERLDRKVLGERPFGAPAKELERGPIAASIPGRTAVASQSLPRQSLPPVEPTREPWFPGLSSWSVPGSNR